MLGPHVQAEAFLFQFLTSYLWPLVLSRPAAAMVELVFGYFATERVAMNAENFRGAGLIAVGAFEDALDEALFEFAYGLIEEDAALHHQ